MPLAIPRLSACLLLAALWVAVGPDAASAQPRIQLDPPSLDFGVLSQHETRDVTVTIRNAGDQPLEIRGIESTCGCTVPQLAVDTVAPGAEVAMEVHFNSKTFQGKQIKYIHIYTNDPRQSAVEYLVTADIKVPLQMDPGEALIRFPTLKRGDTSTVTYTFTSEDVAELEMTVATRPDWLAVDVRPGRDPRQVLVDFTATAAEGGRHRERVRLRSNVPAVPDVDLRADLRVVEDLVLSMEQVNLRMVRPGQRLQTRVRVAPFREGTEFTLTRAEIDIPGLHARVENGSGEAFAVLSGQALDADHPQAQEHQGRIQGTLRIFTDLDSTPELEVPVRYLLRI